MQYTVKEIAQKMEISEHTLRFYTDQGFLPCQRDSHNRRIFDEESLNWLQVIKCLKKCGVSLKDIKIYSDLCQEGNSSLENRYEFMLRQREIAYQRLQEAQELVKYMEWKVSHYESIILQNAPDDTNPTLQKIPACK